MAMIRGEREQQMQQQLEAFEHERRRVEELAHSLSQQATHEWRKAIEGLVALPAALAVGTAATTLYFVSFVTRGFEAFQSQALDASRRMRELDGSDRGRGELGRDERGRDERGRDERNRGELGRPEMPTA